MHLSSGEGGRVPQRRTGWSEADSLCLSKQLLTLRTYLRTLRYVCAEHVALDGGLVPVRSM